jgi:hypothetical protein
LVSLADEILIVHASLDNKQARGDEGFFKKLALKHLYQVFNANIRFLRLIR